MLPWRKIALLDADGIHVMLTSPAIDAGLDSGIRDDVDGDPRPIFGGPDIGADELFRVNDVVLGDAVAVWTMTGEAGGVPDLNGNESPLGLLGSFTFNNDVSDAGINAPNSDQIAAGEGDGLSFAFVIPDPDESSELRRAAQGSMTVFARVRHASYNGIDDVLRMGNFVSEACDTYALELDSGAPRFVVGLPQDVGGPCQELGVTSQALTAGSFYDIIGVFDAGDPGQPDGTLTVYVYDPATGEEVHPPATIEALAIEELLQYANTNFLFLEAPNNANDSNEGGQIELAAVWNRALSTGEVASLSRGQPAFPSFVRGNADGIGGINISDGVFVLNFLFDGGLAPPCREAANADGFGGIDITDVVYILNFLFIGGHPPPAPYPTCGMAGDVECASSPCQ